MGEDRSDVAEEVHAVGHHVALQVLDVEGLVAGAVGRVVDHAHDRVGKSRLTGEDALAGDRHADDVGVACERSDLGRRLEARTDGLGVDAAVEQISVGVLGPHTQHDVAPRLVEAGHLVAGGVTVERRGDAGREEVVRAHHRADGPTAQTADRCDGQHAVATSSAQRGDGAVVVHGVGERVAGGGGVVAMGDNDLAGVEEPSRSVGCVDPHLVMGLGAGAVGDRTPDDHRETGAGDGRYLVGSHAERYRRLAARPIASSAFNQLLGSMTECGILNQRVIEISLGGPPLPLTSSLLGVLVPEFGTKIAPNTPMHIDVVPTVAPFLDEDAGPNGESAELNLAHLQIKFVESRPGVGDIVHLTLAVDAPLGFDLAYDPVGRVLAPQISAPPATSVRARVVDDFIGAVEPTIEALFPTSFPSFVSALGSSFAAFPLPTFLGLGLDVLEVQRAGKRSPARPRVEADRGRVCCVRPPHSQRSTGSVGSTCRPSAEDGGVAPMSRTVSPFGSRADPMGV